MKQISRSEWERIPDDYKGMWTRELHAFRAGDFPESWIGRRTMLEYDPGGGGTCLVTEGVHFEIIEDGHDIDASPLLRPCDKKQIEIKADPCYNETKEVT